MKIDTPQKKLANLESRRRQIVGKIETLRTQLKEIDASIEQRKKQVADLRKRKSKWQDGRQRLEAILDEIAEKY